MKQMVPCVSSQSKPQTCWITTSWDDGHPFDLRIADLLRKYGLSGTFYVPRKSEFNGMRPEEILQISADFEIGAHTLDHVRLNRVALNEANRQIVESRKWIEDVIGKSCRSFCFPGGIFKNCHLRMVHEAGYESARTVELLSLGAPRCMQGLSVLATTLQVFSHPWQAYVRNAIRRKVPQRLALLRPFFQKQDWQTLAKKLVLRAIERKGVFHLWGHSWEIEAEQQWEPLEEFLKWLNSVRSQWQTVNNSGLCDLA